MSVAPDDSKDNQAKEAEPEPPQDNEYVMPEPDLESQPKEDDTTGSQTTKP